MITFDQMATLIKAGYTEQQIRQINQIFSPDTTPTKPEPAPGPEQTPPPAANPITTPDTSPITSPERPEPVPITPPDTAPKESETVTMLKEMMGLIRAGNINSLQSEPKPEAKSEDILAKILNP